MAWGIAKSLDRCISKAISKMHGVQQLTVSNRCISCSLDRHDTGDQWQVRCTGHGVEHRTVRLHSVGNSRQRRVHSAITPLDCTPPTSPLIPVLSLSSLFIDLSSSSHPFTSVTHTHTTADSFSSPTHLSLEGGRRDSVILRGARRWHVLCLPNVTAHMYNRQGCASLVRYLSVEWSAQDDVIASVCQCAGWQCW
jgi:hypothetical protein